MEPPLYLVFFKSKDVDVMTAAFKEYAGIEMDQSKRKTFCPKETTEDEGEKSKTTSESENKQKAEAGTMIREKMQNIQMKRVVILSIPYLIIFYLADKCFWLYSSLHWDSMIEKIV
ncbi:MAG: DUF3801 domain-containing protein [[Clostridium] nexile]